MHVWRCVVLLAATLYSACGQNDLMLPNERLTLDDCHLRFHQLDFDGLLKPVFGVNARLKEFAHMGAIGWIQPDETIQWKCGGTLIWYDFVLTAAHCVVDSSNMPPDVVRFGDLDIYSSEDDEFAQQFKVVEIVRHPNHRFAGNYHDIALLRLERNITLHDTVAPACLWPHEEVRFKTLEATGWGRIGFAREQTPTLQKVNLKPFDMMECSRFYTNETNRKLRFGLQDHHMCAVDEKMDTCEGDSGGPLQIKLLHNSRMTPFVVAITSFGTTCGTAAPGVYTKVAPYMDWIVDTMKKRGAIVDGSTYNTTLCALRFVDYREYEDDVIMRRFKNTLTLNSEKRHMITSMLPSFIVKLRGYGGVNPNCYGVIVDEDTVLTVAACVTHNGSMVTHVVNNNNDEIEVANIHVHPDYIQGNGYNNIAIIRLAKMFSVYNIQPTCIWHDSNIPDEVNVFGFGRWDINVFFMGSHEGTTNSTIVTLTPRATVQSSTTCRISQQHVPQLQRGLAGEHICTGNEIFLVPGSCELMIGGPVQGTEGKGHNLYPMTYGLNQFGRDCGFGEHSIATNLANHVEWMKTVLLPRYQKARNILQFLNPDRHEGDSCNSEDGNAARCVTLSMCIRKWNQFISTGSVQFCSESSVVCCPLDDIGRNEDDNNGAHPDLEMCPNVVKNLMPVTNVGSTVWIGWSTPNSVRFRCLGSIITRTTILSTASCLGKEIPKMVMLASDESKKMYEVEAFIKHNAYNPTDYSNDIALVRLKISLSWSSDVFPSCVWMNSTHTPLVLRMIVPGETAFDRVIAMYNSDCQRTHSHTIHQSQICARNPERNVTCATQTDQLRWDRKDGVFFVVGLGTNAPACDTWNYMLFTRVSAFTEWIGKNLS